MPNRTTVLLLTCCFILLFTAPLQRTLFAQAPTASNSAVPHAWVIPVEGTVDLGMAEFIRRAADEAVQNNADVLLLEMNTFGGRVDAAAEIRDHLLSVPLHTVAFVSKRAISAGALIALATNSIVMAPGATMGAAQPSPLDEKVLSYVRAEFASTAASQGRNERIAEAMVDASVSIEGLVESGEILTLTAQQAMEHGFIDFVADSRQQALDFFGYDKATVVEQRMTWTEQVLRFLTEPVVAQILLTIGFLGLLAEITSPGWGIPGSLGIVSLVLFFGSRFVVGVLGFGVIALFIVGLILLLIELFIIPGFGIVGVLGIAAIGTSLFLSFPEPAVAFQALAITALATIILIVLFLRRFQNAALWGGIVLKDNLLDSDDQPVAQHDEYLHKCGIAVTPLRPAGKVQIEDEILDAVSEGQFIKKGQQVQVIQAESMRLVVRSGTKSPDDIHE